jgi:hypothetical protein
MWTAFRHHACVREGPSAEELLDDLERAQVDGDPSDESQVQVEAGTGVDLASNPAKPIEVVEIGEPAADDPRCPHPTSASARREWRDHVLIYALGESPPPFVGIGALDVLRAAFHLA